METLAAIPAIIREGGDWYGAMGTAGSKGTKVFALSGAVANTGLVEVPMGTSLRTVVLTIGGGVPGGEGPDGGVKAVQTGGPSGGCIPAALLDTPVDYESLRQLGSMMGSGGMVVMGESTAMPAVAAISCASAWLRAAASACPAAPAPCSCWSCSTDSPSTAPAWRIWSGWSSCAAWCRPPVSAAWARRRPTRC